MRKTQQIAMIAMFAALQAVLYLPEGPWRSFVIYLLPVEGIVLGPMVGFSTALLGSVIARILKPDMWWMFGIIAEPIGVLAAGFLARGRWKETLAIYSFMLGAYFTHPYGRVLPLWTILDLLIAFILIYPVSKCSRWLWQKPSTFFATTLVLVAFISTATDSLTRVFLLVPAGFYNLFSLSYETLAYGWFIPGAVGSYIEDLLVCVVTMVIGVPLILSLRKTALFELHLPESLSEHSDSES